MTEMKWTREPLDYRILPGRIEITTAPQPDHEANETLLVQVGDLAGVYRETGFEFDLSPGGQMKHRAVRVIV